MSTLPTLERIARVLRARDLLEEVRGREDVTVYGVSQDSRTVEEGDLFLAWRGVDHDAHDSVPEAVRAGAVALVVERPLAEVDLPQLVVHDGRLAGALAADVIRGSPWRELVLVGVTGTNGKTTTALVLRRLLERLGGSASIGTLGLVEPDGRVRPETEGLTTPGPVRVETWLRDLADRGARCVTLEASSHALEQRRLDGLRMDAGVFTNLGRDHLDYHPDQEAYRDAKLRLVELFKEGGTAVVNAAEPAWRSLPTEVARFTWAVDGADAPPADLRAEELRLSPSGSRFTLVRGEDRIPTEFPLPGRFNVENALAAAGAALVLGIPLREVAEDLSRMDPVPGRMEVVVTEPFTVLVDFAHTPDALDAVLNAVRPLVDGRLVVVFGAGGDRDRTKRRPMAEAVARHADFAVLTSDNPRTEDPDSILDDLEEGLGGVEHVRVPDRREAIGRALGLAGEGDVVLLAGKGHETYQVVGTERRPFDERVVVKEWLGRGGNA